MINTIATTIVTPSFHTEQLLALIAFDRVRRGRFSRSDDSHLLRRTDFGGSGVLGRRHSVELVEGS